MSSNVSDYRQLIRSALRHATVVQSPECPEPEVMLDWIDQGDAYPEARRLLDHLFTCAYCRGEYTDLCQLQALRAASRPALDNPARSLPTRVKAWVRELIAEGITTPVASVRAALQKVDRLAAATSRSASGVTSGTATPFDLRPAFTAIRSQDPTLRWSVEQAAQEYEVVILPQIDGKQSQTVWKDRVGAEPQLALPAAAGLRSGGVYLWQVSALIGGAKTASSPVGLVVLTNAAKRRVETLEQEIGDSPLGLIGLYEAYGLYHEALQQAETLLQRSPDDAVATRIREQLLQRAAPTTRQSPSPERTNPLQK